MRLNLNTGVIMLSRIGGILFGIGILSGVAIAAKPASIIDAEDRPTAPAFMAPLMNVDSRYGQGWFPEPLLAPEMDVERELRFDYFHGEKKGLQQDSVKAEIEWSFGMLTIEVEAEYSREKEASINGLGRL